MMESRQGWATSAAILGTRTRAARIVSAVVAPMIVALAVLGGVGSFATVREMAEPHFGGLAWIVPIGMDLGISILLAWDLLMEYLGLPWPVLRWVAWAYIVGTVLVNVAAADGALAGSVMHAAMPLLFVTVVEGVRHLIRQWVGLATGSRVERVPATRWVLAPISSLLLWRRMILWHITGYRQGLELEYRHLMAVSALQQEYGRWSWRWRAPLAERLALRKLPAETDASTHCGPVDEASSTGEAAFGDQPSRPTPFPRELLVAARQISGEAEQQGQRLTRVMLGRRLRELGFSIANDRLASLITAVREQPMRQEGP
ncbi:DUF2637 domain-containing protein [Actinomadura sp. NBRC 104425]|uniref:DUF2637 domain-containing protein n=1 Tax=Actinomadura sp. NBRC 104425 TaxID=3032204 RepID=UPI0025537B3D|nr:DUF2637 domain-containing protein [Actinomadura sp. NBRC 104425]